MNLSSSFVTEWIINDAVAISQRNTMNLWPFYDDKAKSPCYLFFIFNSNDFFGVVEN